MFTIGQRVVLAGSPGEGEILHDYREGSVAVGWDGIGMRVHHVSQLAPAPTAAEVAQARREREEALARAEWEAGPDPYEPSPYNGDEPDYDGWCGP